MELDDILKQYVQGSTGTEKTASVARITAAEPIAPVADTDAVSALLKMASELQGAEKRAEEEVARVLGMSFADAAINRFAQYQHAVKTAADMDQEAIAEIAAAAEQEGYEKAMAEVAEVIRGGEEGEEGAEELPEGMEEGAEELPEGMDAKVAEYYADGMDKLAAAADYFDLDGLAKYAYDNGLGPVLEQFVQDYGGLLEKNAGDESEDDVFEKLAEAAAVMSPEEFEQYAVDNDLAPALEKIAEDYAAGVKQAEEEISYKAQEEFLKGAEETETLLDMLRKQANTGVAPNPAQIAAMRAGGARVQQQNFNRTLNTATQAVTPQPPPPPPAPPAPGAQ